MSLTGSLTTAVSGLKTAQRQIQVTSGNVSNANVEGYTRKSADPQSIIVGNRNAGVELGTVRREVDSALVSEVRQQQSTLSNLQTLGEFHSRVQTLFGTLDNDATLSNQLNNLKTTLEALAVEPETPAPHTDVVEAAQRVARQFNRLSRQTQELRAEADNQIDIAVKTINDKLVEIRDLNEKIASAQAVGDPTGDLADQRDQALAKLSEFVDLRTFERSTGETVVYTTQGDLLVDRTAQTLSFTRTGGFTPGSTASPVTFADDDPGTTADDATPAIGGRLGALLQARDATLPDFQADIDQLATKLREEVNAVHNLGAFGNQPTAASDQILGFRNFRNDASPPSIADGIASVSGTLELVEVDGNGDVVNTISIDMSNVNSNLGPGNDIQALVAALNTEATNNGASNNPFQFSNSTVKVNAPNANDFLLRNNDAQVTGDLGTRGFSHYFGFNDFFQTPGVPADPVAAPADDTAAAAVLQVRSDIVADPEKLSSAAVKTASGEPPIAAGDPTIAQQLAAVFDASFSFTTAGNLDARTTTLAGYAGDILQFQASETARLENAADFQRSLHDELKFRAESKSGVNIDEEMSKLLVFEQAFNASARVISTVQDMFNRLDAMMR